MNYAITHNDLDGIGCAVLFEKVFPDIQTFPIPYTDLDTVLPQVLAKANGSTVYITDISLNENMAQLCDQYLNINHIDHHSSSKKLSDKYEWSFTDVSHCATYHLYGMLSEYAHIEDYKPFVDLVDDYDTWGHGTQPSEQARDLNRLLQMIGPETFVQRFRISSSVELTRMESTVIATDKFQEEEYLKECESLVSKLEDPDGNVFLFIAAERYTSSLGNHLLKCDDQAEYVLMLDMLHNKASLRSKGKVDVGEMAKACGGGGHKRASGFPLSEQAIQIFWRCKNCEWKRPRNPDMDK